MIIEDGVINCLRGERFTQTMSGFDYAKAGQIVVLIFKSSEQSHALSFVKNATDEYPNAGLISLNEEGKMIFTIDTESLSPGIYDIEGRVDVVGVLAPIIKERNQFLKVNPSRT